MRRVVALRDTRRAAKLQDRRPSRILAMTWLDFGMDCAIGSAAQAILNQWSQSCLHPIPDLPAGQCR
jgi:hypothetical protein